MLSALLLSTALLPLAPDAAAQASPSARLEVVARVEAGRFVAVNLGERARLIVLADTLSSARAVVVLPPGGEFETRFPASALEGLTFELIAPGAGSLSTTGVFSLPALRDARLDAVLVESSPRGVLVWGQRESSLQPLVPDRALSALAPGSGAALSSRGPLHVPVITPAGKKTGDRPPRLEQQPLPPM